MNQAEEVKKGLWADPQALSRQKYGTRRRYAILSESDIQEATRRLLGHNLGIVPSPSVDIA